MLSNAHRIVVICAVLGLCLALPVNRAAAARGHQFGRSFGWGVVDGKPELQTCTTKCLPGLAGSGRGQFSEPRSVAVSAATGDVYVVDQGNTRVERFKLTNGAYEYDGQFDGSGEFETEGKKEKGAAPPSGKLATPEGNSHEGPEVIAIAVDNDASSPSYGDVYVADVAHDVVDKFSRTGEYINQLSFPSTLIDGVAVDAIGDLWVATHIGSAFRYSNEVANTQLADVMGIIPGHFNVQGFAVDAKDHLFLHSDESENGQVFELGPGGCAQRNCNPEEIIDERVDGEASEGLAAELSSGDLYVDNVGSLARFGPAVGGLNPELERVAVPSGDGGGVGVGLGPGPVFVTGSGSELVDEFELEPPTAPTVTGESVKEVTGDGAAFEAEVNPRSEANEEPTSYVFQYVTQQHFEQEGFAQAASVPVPAGRLAANYEPDVVTAEVSGLAARTSYHFRVVAENAVSRRAGKPSEGERNGSGEEVAHSFTTQPGGGLVLPDGRAWELVSPAQKLGADLLSGSFEGVLQAAADGRGVAFLASGPTEALVEGNDNETQVLATRGTSGWTARNMTVAHNGATGASLGTGDEFRAFSPDLSSSAVQQFGAFQALSSQATEQTPYVRSDYLSGNLEEPCLPVSMTCYTPLVTSEDATSGQAFGEAGQCPHSEAGGGKTFCGPLFVGASADLSQIVVSSSVGLTSGAGSAGGLYEWSHGQLAFIGGGELGSHEGAGRENSRGAVSADGSRVVFSSAGHLFLRDLNREETVMLDAPEAHCLAAHTCGGGFQRAEYQLASSDGSRVFFKDSKALTEGAGSYSIGEETDGDLYECAIVEENEKLKCELTDLTPRVDVHGTVIGASEDGSWLYFTAGGVLAGAANARGETAVAGKCVPAGSRAFAANACNLYVRHDGATRLVAVLSAADGADVNGRLTLAGLTARVSPDGRWLAFSSQRPLTGYDNRDAASGRRDQEVFLYDAQAGGGSGQVFCASCNPTGARPHGIEYGRVGLLASGQSVWEEDQWVAALLPGWTAYELNHSLYQPRYLSDSGRLFFNSDDALAPQDVNGTWDVYEYEPPGVGDCATASVTFSAGSGGCVGLISSGASPEESAFLDASEAGGDVFFLTAAQLSAADRDTAVDLYDAHECTAVSPCLPAAVHERGSCTTTESCRPSPTPQPEVFGAPPSALFTGPGNLIPPPTMVTTPARCKKGFVRKHGKCVRKAKQRPRCRKHAGAKHRKCAKGARHGANGAAGRK